jgi:hypothetical protein
MSYPWQRARIENLFETIRKQPISFDSWVLVTYDDAHRTPGEQPKTALWFSVPEEAKLYLSERMVSLWVGPQEQELAASLQAQVDLLKAARKLKLRELENWRKAFNALAETKGQILWLGTFDDLQRGETSADELASDLENWLNENEYDLTDLDPDDPRQQRLLVDFFVQLGG